MERHKLGTYAGGVAGLQAICDIVSSGEPTSTPVVYEQIGTDLNGLPIPAGFGSTVWTWNYMSQEDYQFLLDKQGDVEGVAMTIYTQKRSGASGIDFDNYSCIMARPVFERRDQLTCYNVSIAFTGLLAI